MRYFKALLLFLFLLMANPTKVSATFCDIGQPSERISKAPVIFRAVAKENVLDTVKNWFLKQSRGNTDRSIPTHSNHTSMKIKKVYKGDVSGNVTVSGKHAFIQGNEYIIFTSEDLEISYCDLPIDLTKEKSHQYIAPMLVLLEKYSAHAKASNKKEELALLISGMDELIEDLEGSALEAVLNHYKAEFLEDNDPAEASKAYEKSLSLSHKWHKKKYHEMKGHTVDSTFYQGNRCDPFKPETTDTPDFFQPIEPGYYTNRGSEVMLGYGRSLFKMGEFQKALFPLCIAEQGRDTANDWHSEASAWKVLSLLKIGRIDEIGIGPFDFNGMSISRLDLTGISLRNSNFSNTHINHLTIRDADLSGVVFNGAQIDSFDISNSKLVHSSFKNATASGSITSSDLSASTLVCASLDLDFVKDSFFVNADISHATIKANKVVNTKLPTSPPKSSDASFCNPQPFDDTSDSPARTPDTIKKLDNSIKIPSVLHKTCQEDSLISLKQLTREGQNDYTGKDFTACVLGKINLSGKNFMNAKFKGADLSDTSFVGATLDRADFDGARITQTTKFPVGFDTGKFRLIPTNPINDKGAPWQFSNVGRSWGLCEWHGVDDSLINIKPQLRARTLSFSNEDLSGLDIYSAWLPGADMSNADLSGTDLSSSNLIGANFHGAKMISVVLQGALLDNADLRNTDLRGANLQYTRMTGARLNGTDLRGASYDDSTLFPTGFVPEDHGLIKVAGHKRSKDRWHVSKEFLAKNKISGLPDNTEIHAIGIYSSRVSSTGNSPPAKLEQGLIKVHLEKKDIPLFLVLTAYNPTIWRLTIEDGVDLRGVLLGGMLKQDIIGEPQGTRIYNFTTQYDPQKRVIFYATRQCGKDYDMLLDVVEGVTGKSIYSFQSSHSENVFSIK